MNKTQKITSIIEFMAINAPENTTGVQWSHWTIEYSETNDLPKSNKAGLYWNVDIGEAIPIYQYFIVKGMKESKKTVSDIKNVKFIFVYYNA